MSYGSRPYGSGPYGSGPYGTAHRLPTYRPPGVHERRYVREIYQRPTLTGGVTFITTRAYKATKDNIIGDQIEIGGGTIDIDLDRAIKGTVKLEARDPRIIPTWSWVAIFAEIVKEDGTTDAFQVGLYRMRQAEGRVSAGWAPVTIPGEDITTLLHNKRFTDIYNVAAGTNKAEVLGQLAEYAGITRHDFPDTTGTFTTAKSWNPGVSVWEAMSETCSSLGWYAPLATNLGVLTSFPYRDAAKTSPARTYLIGEDARILGDIDFDRDDSSFANEIIVVSEAFDREPISATAVNDDPDSKASTTHPEGPGTISRVFNVNEVEDELILLIRAIQELRQRSMLASVTLETLIEPTLSVHDVIALAGGYDYSDELRGVWLLQQLTYNLSTGRAVLKARRNEVQ